MIGWSNAVSLGETFFAVMGIALFLCLNFACYYFPLRFVLAKAGQPPLALRYYVQGFLAMILAGVILAIGLQVLLAYIAS